MGDIILNNELQRIRLRSCRAFWCIPPCRSIPSSPGAPTSCIQPPRYAFRCHLLNQEFALPQKYGVVVEPEPPAKCQVEMTQGRPMSAAERIRSSNDAFKAAENTTQEIEAPPAPPAPSNDAPPAMPSLADVPGAQLYDYMQRLFKIGDVDGSGALDSVELHTLLGKSGFKFSDEAIQDLMISADTNHDGLIQFDEFCVAIKGLQSGGLPTGAPAMPALASVPAAQLYDYMQRLFKIGDVDGSGALDSVELRNLLRKSGFKFSDEAI